MKSYYPLVKKLLQEKGFSKIGGGKGSHEMWTDGNQTLTVPHNLYSRHTANDILKDAGIGKKF